MKTEEALETLQARLKSNLCYLYLILLVTFYWLSQKIKIQYCWNRIEINKKYSREFKHEIPFLNESSE